MRSAMLAGMLMTTCLSVPCGGARVSRKPMMRGFNYVRIDNPKGGKHTTFAPGTYDAGAAGQMFATLQAHGFNCVRVFISAAHCRPGSIFPEESDTELSAAYMDNFADFLGQADQRSIRVIPAFEFLPLVRRYASLAGAKPSELRYINRMIFDPGYIRARQAFMADFVGAIKERGSGLLRVIHSYDIHNEACFHISYPFDRDGGSFTAPNGRTYDLAKDKKDLADDAAVYWVDAMTDAIRGVDPEARVLLSAFTYDAVGRTGPGDFAPSRAAWKNRYPFRPLAMTRSKADFISIHFYPKDAEEYRAELKSVEFDVLKAEAVRTGKTLVCTEFGAFKNVHKDATATARWLAELRRLILGSGFAGCLHWQYDTKEQPRLWNAVENDGLILKALARQGRTPPRSSRNTTGEYMKRPDVRVAGPWRIEVDGSVLAVEPSEIVAVERERYGKLPLFDATQPGWRRGQRLFRCQSQETSVKDGVVPGSLKVYAAADTDTPLEEGRDYRFDAEWSVVGRVPGGGIDEKQPVWISYRYGLARIDSIVHTAAGELLLRSGSGHICVPVPPAVTPGERALANVWVSPRLKRLTGEHIFPILETAYPEPPTLSLAEARRLLPKTWKKLESGGTLRVLAWGDSVTHAGYLRGRPGFPETRWQGQFVIRLCKRFPDVKIELMTAAWGGRGSRHFVQAPPADREHHYETVVLGAKPDLVVMEFVNDSYLRDAAKLEEAYGKFLADFRRIGAEWIILSPHYVRPDWMGLKREKNIDEDPRPYVANLRAFCAKHGVPLADASKRWGRLWRRGIPYTTLLLNAINHPDERGMAIFADSLMCLFPAKKKR